MDAENHPNSRRRRVSKEAGRSPAASRSPAGTADVQSASAAIRDAFRARIGEDRHDVWFGGNFEVSIEPEGNGILLVTVAVGSAFTHEWLRRTFHDDFAAAAEDVLGRRHAGATRVVWTALPADPAEVGRDDSRGNARPARATSAGRSADDEQRVEQRPRRSREAGPGRPGVAAVGGGTEVAVEKNGATLRGVSQPSGGACEAGYVRPSAPVRPALTLEQYVIGAGNRMAHAAAVLAAEQPGAISPLVILGPSGVGKTHLLEGLCRRARERAPRSATVMLSAEQFTTTFLESLHGRRGLPGFRRSLRSADLLVIDDLQFFIGKKATISELLHTLEALQRAGKQVVFGSDRDVESLAELGADLQARLRGGMCARILPPDEATRAGIVESLAARRGITIPGDVVAFVAARMTRNTRELAGAVNRLEATSHMLGIPVTLDMAGECLAELVRSSSRAVRLVDIERAVCTALGVDPGSLQSSCRVRRVNQPRMLAMFLARKHTPAALTEIGAYFGRRSHSTVISAQRTVDGWIATGSRLTLADAEWGIEEAIRRVEETLRAG
jgi:chromosomal replication initiator protein